MSMSRKILSAGMAFCMLITGAGLTSCRSSKKTQTITEDTPWYSLQRIQVCDQYGNNDTIEYYDTGFIGLYEDKMCYITSGMYKIPEDVDFSTIDMNSYNFCFVDIYGMDGSLYRSIDVQKDIDISEALPQGEMVSDCSVRDMEGIKIINGKLMLVVNAILFPSWAENRYTITYDLENEAVESVELTVENNDQYTVDNVSVGLDMNGSYMFDGYLVETYSTYVVGAPTKISIVDPSGERTTYEITEVLPDLETCEISDVIYLGDNKALTGFLAGNRIDKTYYVMDLISGEFTLYNEDTSWFSNYFTACEASYIEGVGYVLTDNDGIKKLDFENKTVTQLFSYDNCNINRHDTRDVNIVDYTDDRIILTGTYWRESGTGSLSKETMFYVLEKQETNPNAGKTILTAATLTEFDYTFCEAVCSFNETDPDFFVTLESKYSMREMYLSGRLDRMGNGYDLESLEAQTELSNQLIIDLMAGDGPDIILDGASYYQLNNEEYLIDLSSEIDVSGLFENVIESAKVDGKIYQLPLNVSLNGIITRRSDIADDACGFTFEQYGQFIEGPCNGEEPIGLGQNDFFVACLASMNDECIVGNTVDLHTEHVNELASFVSESIYDPITDPEDEIVDFYQFSSSRGLSAPTYSSDISFGTFISKYYNDDIYDITIAGIPSPDGRGPLLSVGSSIAVSAKTSQKDACVSFVRTLLSGEIQDSYGTTTMSIPVRISSFENSAEQALEEVNSDIRDYMRYVNTYGIHDPFRTEEEIDHSVIDDFEAVISSSRGIVSMDPAVMIIVKEEMPAYFAGQKTLDEVLNLIENRVTTFLNERG